ncbi:MAG: sugar kinase [Kordiimonadaceae bacterium]|nr:sugar kinase [Kordiimonadaceae bacterium]
MVEPMKIAFVGECMFEERAQGLQTNDYGQQVVIGGDTLNAAVYFSRLNRNKNTEVFYVSLVGGGPKDAAVIEEIQAEDINCDLIEQVPGSATGSYKVYVADDGERSFSYDRSCAPARALFEGATGDFRIQKVAQFDVLYVTGITLAVLYEPSRKKLLQLMRAMKSEGKVVVYDCNHRPRLWEDNATAKYYHETALAACSLALPSIEDLTQIFGQKSKVEYMQMLTAMDIPAIVLKDGDGGAVSHFKEETKEHALPTVERPVDTTGAGDSFNAGLLTGLLKGCMVSESIELGHSIACEVIMSSGAITPRV